MSNFYISNCPFLPPVVVTYHTQESEWELLETYHIRGLVIKKGFRFDLASIPRAFWWVIAPFELSLVAPLAHDYLYRTGGEGGVFTRAQADRMFEELMEWEKVSWWRRKLAYAAVRSFGAQAWRG